MTFYIFSFPSKDAFSLTNMIDNLSFFFVALSPNIVPDSWIKGEKNYQSL